MTTPEHALVGIHAAVATGLSYRYDWNLIALAGIASIIPDWDGIPMLFDMSRFESGHRVWGHNFISILLSSFLLAWSQSHYCWLEYIGKKIVRFLPSDANLAATNSNCSTAILFLIAVIVQVIHLPCDMVVSGGNGLSDWLTKPFWPFNDAGFVYPLIPWGDVGPTIILMAGLILSAKYPTNSSGFSIGTLACLCVYLIVRGSMHGAV
ncbi:MAG: metal-dependent hydrolase [Planctomycetota bacterium]|nr:metal-dependent hydrolase [Planctomycetota bacterium]